jgi:uncharacterized protein
MSTVLSEIEARVLASLVEKQITTPEYYPLTLNSLTTACNQKNNRNPVTAYSEDQVSQALEILREKNLAYVFYGSTSRVPKYKHVMPEVLHLSPPEVALICVLILRGPQTPGELRGNASRLHEFHSLEEIEQTLNDLMSRDGEPLVVRLPRQAGQKEIRFAHLLCGDVVIDESAESILPRRPTAASQTDRLTKLEEEISALKGLVEELRQQLETFKRQFE